MDDMISPHQRRKRRRASEKHTSLPIIRYNNKSHKVKSHDDRFGTRLQKQNHYPFNQNIQKKNNNAKDYIDENGERRSSEIIEIYHAVDNREYRSIVQITPSEITDGTNESTKTNLPSTVPSTYNKKQMVISMMKVLMMQPHSITC